MLISLEWMFSIYFSYYPSQNHPDCQKYCSRCPDRCIHKKRQSQAEKKTREGNPSRIETMLRGEAQRGEVGEGVVDQDGEGAEGPCGFDSADTDK